MSEHDTDRHSNSTNLPITEAHDPDETISERESPEMHPSLRENLADTQSAPFPFLRLPIEIRTLVYLEALVQPDPIACHSNHLWFRRYPRSSAMAYHPLRPASSSTLVLSVRTFRGMSLTSRGIYRESAQIFFAHNAFKFPDLECIPAALKRLTPDSRRAIANVALVYAGIGAPKAFKALATCIGLRRLHITLDNFETMKLMPSSHLGTMKLFGIGECLKLRGLTHVEVDRVGNRDYDSLFTDLPKFRKALKVLKQPQNPAHLARLDKKDYPNRLHRSVFGKANVTTRMENKIMGTVPRNN